MKNKIPLLLILGIIIFVLTSLIVVAENDMPIGLKKIIDYNQKNTQDFALKITYFIAFVAGILAILSPCILPILPAYFSYTFKEKKNITLMTVVFFAGFSTVFVSMGIIASLLGSQTLIILQKGWLVIIAGIFLILLGIMSILGKGFSSFIKPKYHFKNDITGTFLFGIFFAIGWTACLGPILAGILGIGAILDNIWKTAILMFFYSLGNLVPLFILSVFYDKFNLQNSKIIKGKLLDFSIGGKKIQVHTTNLVSGLLFLLIGIVLVIYKGTTIVNNLDIFGTKYYFYTIQRQLMAWQYANTISIIIFALFLLFLGFFFWRSKKNR